MSNPLPPDFRRSCFVIYRDRGHGIFQEKGKKYVDLNSYEEETFTVILNSFIPDDTKTMTDLCLKFDDVAKKDIVKKKYTLVSGKTLCSNDHYE